MAEKFAEDERLEQLNAQRRRMKEAEHKREINRLWDEKLSMYRMQRDQEEEEIRRKAEEERIYNAAVEDYKRQLLEQNAMLLSEFNPKAASQYDAASYAQAQSHHPGFSTSQYPQGSIQKQ